MRNLVTGVKSPPSGRSGGLQKEKLSAKAMGFVKILLRTLFLLGMGYVMLYPILFALSGAFKARVDVYDPTVIWLPKHYSMEAMNLAVKSLKFWDALKQTLIILIPSVCLQMISTLMAGYAFARFKFRERGILFAGLIFTIIVPVQNLIVPLYANFQSFDMFGLGYLYSLFSGGSLPNLLNTPFPFYLMAAFGMGIRSGLYIFIMRQFFRNMPPELEEAALIDGCSPLQTYLRVMLPNAVMVMVTVFMFSLVWHWNDAYTTSILSPNNRTLSVALSDLRIVVYRLNDAGGDDPVITQVRVQAGALLSILPMLILFLFTQKAFTESIERTGIVG